MKNLCLILSLFVANNIIWSQLELKPSKSKGWINKKMSTQAYFDFNRTMSFRSLTSNEDFLNKPLNERAFETPSPLWSFGLGMSTGLNKWINLEAGMNYLKNGEAYHYTSSITDSTLNYFNQFRYIGLPLSINVHYGSSFNIYGGIGVNPLLFSSFLQKRDWTSPLGSKMDELIKLKSNEFESYVIQVYAQAGVSYIGLNGWGFYVKGVYRQQLTNSYTKNQGYIHKANGIGFSFGLNKTIS